VGFSFQTVSKRYSILENKERNSVRVKILDNSYIESAIISLFKINIDNYIRTKAILAKEFHIQPSEFDLMPVWEYELFIKEINDAVKEDNEKNQKEMDKYGYKDVKKMSDPKYAQNMANKQMPKLSDMKMPSMPSMPKL
jgi:hypothetical protein